MNPISVLLVHDNLSFLRVVTRFLQEHNDEVVVSTAAGGEDLLAQLPNTPKDFQAPFLAPTQVNILGCLSFNRLDDQAAFDEGALAEMVKVTIKPRRMISYVLHAVRCLWGRR